MEHNAAMPKMDGSTEVMYFQNNTKSPAENARVPQIKNRGFIQNL